MDYRLKFNKNNIPKEIEEFNQTVHEFSIDLAKAKRDYVICEKEISELTKDQKEDLKIEYAKIYQEMSAPKIADAKIKCIVYDDDRFKDFLKRQRNIMQKKIIELGDLTEKFELAQTNYYSATNKRTLITEGTKLMLGGFIEVNTGKINEEFKKIKSKKLLKKKE